MFIISESLAGNVCRYFAINEGDNLSDHIPVVVHIDVNICSSHVEERVFSKKISWKKAKYTDILSYKCLLSDLLNNIYVPVNAMNCTNMFCKDHQCDIDRYYSAIISSCIDSASRCIPTTSKPKLAGWNDHVKPFKDQSIFWHRLWIDNGKPRSGIIADIRRRTRSKYKQAVKLVKRNQSNFRAEKW